MLDFRMTTFLELCKRKNYTKTAESLCITQPAVTQHIKYLEQYYGGKLFQYVGRKLELTKNGEMLYYAALTMAADEEKMKKRMSLKEEGRWEFRFGSTLTIGEFVLPRMLNQLIVEEPRIDIAMIVDNTSILLEKIKKGEIDFAFIEGYFNKEEYDHALFMKERFVAVTADGDLAKEEVNFEDLLKEALIIREEGSGSREILARVLNERNITLHNFKRVVEIGNISAIKHMVMKGCGITFLYESAVKEEIENGLLFEIPVKDLIIIREFNFVMLKNSLYSKEYYGFLNRLVTNIRI